jgi:hypothetical protein
MTTTIEQCTPSLGNETLGLPELPKILTVVSKTAILAAGAVDLSHTLGAEVKAAKSIPDKIRAFIGGLAVFGSIDEIKEAGIFFDTTRVSKLGFNEGKLTATEAMALPKIKTCFPGDRTRRPLLGGLVVDRWPMPETGARDPKRTRLGVLLSLFGIDELPHVGEVGLVGVRPVRKSELDSFSQSLGEGVHSYKDAYNKLGAGVVDAAAVIRKLTGLDDLKSRAKLDEALYYALVKNNEQQTPIRSAVFVLGVAGVVPPIASKLVPVICKLFGVNTSLNDATTTYYEHFGDTLKELGVLPPDAAPNTWSEFRQLVKNGASADSNAIIPCNKPAAA